MGVPVVTLFEHARQDFHLISFAPLRGELVLPGLSLVEPDLDIGLA